MQEVFSLKILSPDTACTSPAPSLNAGLFRVTQQSGLTASCPHLVAMQAHRRPSVRSWPDHLG